MNKVLTIIVPSYNTEKFIDECLPTIIACDNNDLEVLVVNDGSTDGTREKAEKYQNQYPDIVRIINKENGGHGSAINRGIKEATGKYLKIVDGDDWVFTDGLNRLVGFLKEREDDIVINPYVEIREDTGHQRICKYNTTVGSMKLSDYLLQNRAELGMASLTYRTLLLKENSIKIREKCLYVDTEFILYPLVYAKTITALDFPIYKYRLGTATQSVNPRVAFRNRNMHQLMILDCINFYKEHFDEMETGVKTYFEKVISTRIVSQYNIYFKGKITREVTSEIRNWDNKLKESSTLFYKATNKIPINILRKNTSIFPRLLSPIYRIYFQNR